MVVREKALLATWSFTSCSYLLSSITRLAVRSGFLEPPISAALFSIIARKIVNLLLPMARQLAIFIYSCAASVAQCRTGTSHLLQFHRQVISLGKSTMSPSGTARSLEGQTPLFCIHGGELERRKFAHPTLSIAF